MKKLALVVGHTHEEPGASMVFPYDYIQEYEYNSVLAGIITECAKKSGILCQTFLRDNVGIMNTYKNVKAWAPDAAIELHFNSFASVDAYGTETLYGGIKGSEKLAINVHTEIVELFSSEFPTRPDRDIKYCMLSDRGGHSLNNGTDIPVVLIEPFFGSNKQDAEMGLRKIYELANAVIEGFLTWVIRDIT